MQLSDPETVAMIEELVGRAALACAETINAALAEIYDQSQVEVPKGPPDHHEERAARDEKYPAKTLAKSGEIHEATPLDLVGQVVYDSPYAGAQEAGRMTYESRSGKKVEWEVTQYTTAGTKAHYLEDPSKAALGAIPEELAIQGRISMEELPGLATPVTELRSAGKAHL